MSVNHHEWLKGMKDGLPIAFGYMAVSFTFGIIAKQAGLNPFEAVFLSITNLTSAGQFAGVTLMVAAATLLEVALIQLIINSRYLLMSFALSQKIDPNTSILKRMLMAYGVTDEIFAVTMSKKGRIHPNYMYGLISVAMPGWALGTYLGVVSGTIFPDRIISALSIALYGMLIAVIVPPARKEKKVAGIIAVSMIASLLFSLIPLLSTISSGVKMVILTIVITGLAAFIFPVKERAYDN